EKERAALESTLAAWGCQSAFELDQRLAAAQGRLQLAIGELEAIAKEEPALPDRLDQDFESVRRRIEALKGEKAEIEREAEGLRAAIYNLRRRQAELEGAHTVNVAQ